MNSTNKSNEDNSDENSSSLLEAIGSSTLGIQSTFGSMYNTLEKSLQQNVQMTQSMIQMMDEMFKANLKIASFLEPIGDGKIKLKLVISNRTRIPTIAMTGSIMFQVEDNKIDIMYKEPYDNLTNLFESPCNLQPQTQYKQEIELHLKELIQCSGCILLSIPNPLTQEKKIEIKHAFGLYLIDQLVKEIVDDKTICLERVEEKGSYSIAFIRQIMEIHPIKGIDLGMCIRLSSSFNVEIMCKITSISDDFNTVGIQFYSNHKETVCKLIVELNILSSLSS